VVYLFTFAHGFLCAAEILARAARDIFRVRSSDLESHARLRLSDDIDSFQRILIEVQKNQRAPANEQPGFILDDLHYVIQRKLVKSGEGENRPPLHAALIRR
jgi:hypothetical protein